MADTRERKRRLGPDDTIDKTVSSDHNFLSKYALADTSPDVQIQRLGYKYFEEMEIKDGRYSSFLSTRKNAALHLGWDVLPASDDAKDQERAACVKSGLLMAEGSFKQDLRDMLDAIAKGYKLLEKIYGFIPSGDHKNRIGLARLKSLPQWDYGPVSDTHRAITGVTSRFGYSPEVLPAQKFVLHVFNPSNEDPLGRGVASACSWWYWFKKEGAKWWAMSAERFAMPFPVITEPRNPNSKDRAYVRQMIAKIQSETGIVLPFEFALKLEQASQDGVKTYEGLINLSNEEMAITVLGSSLSVQQAKGSTGTYAQASVHAQTPAMYALEDADNIEETVQSQIVNDLDDLNYGLGEPYPQFAILREKTEITRDRALNIQRAQRAGVRVPEKWAYKEFNIPMPATGEAVLEPVQAGGGEPGGAANFAEDPELIAANEEIDALLKRSEALALDRYAAAFSEIKARLGKKKA